MFLALMETDSLHSSLTYLSKFSIPDTCSLGSGLTAAGQVAEKRVASVKSSFKSLLTCRLGKAGDYFTVVPA